MKYVVWLPHKHYSIKVILSPHSKMWIQHPSLHLPHAYFQIISMDQKEVPRIQDATDFLGDENK